MAKYIPIKARIDKIISATVLFIFINKTNKNKSVLIKLKYFLSIIGLSIGSRGH